MDNQYLLDLVKMFIMFLFVGGLLRRWIYEKINNIIYRFFIISSVIASIVLLFTNQNIIKHAMIFSLIIIAVISGMALDAFLDHITTQKAKQRMLKK